MKKLKERLVWARKRAGKTQKDVVDFVGQGFTQPNYSQLENGKVESTAFIAHIAHYLGVNAYWLASGKGEADLGPDAEFIRAFMDLDDEQRQALIRLARSMNHQSRAS